ncbi:MAG: phospholipase D family protein [Solirubrobacteraceae bacterium]
MTGRGRDLVSGLDRAVGGSLERIVCAKHGRRLGRLGWSGALHPDDGLWATGEPPPRPGCRLEVLIDGEHAFAAIAGAIKAARKFVYVTGWHVAPHFELVRGDPSAVLGTLLAEVAERVDVRILVWAGAPLAGFHPSRKEVDEGIEALTRSTRIRCQRDPREHPFHCHHEKTVIVDGEVAFVGGIDMTDFGGDRNDSREHAAHRRLGWHDVGTKLQGPAVADVYDHFAQRWAAVAGERLPKIPAPPAAAGSTVQVVRTVSEDMYDDVPRGDFRILESYVWALRSAEHYIYLENQFLWAPEIVGLLGDKLRNPPREEFRIVVVLPARANNGQDDTKGQLAKLVAADRGHARLLAATLRSRSGTRTDPLYVHAKVGIVDDRWLTIGSANLNAHSLYNDTEMNVVTDDAELARATRIALWSEHLELDPAVVEAGSPREVIDERWHPIATEQLGRHETGEAATHRLLALPGVSRRSARLLGPLQGLLDDG